MFSLGVVFCVMNVFPWGGVGRYECFPLGRCGALWMFALWGGVGRYGCLPRGAVWGAMDDCPVGRCGALWMFAPWGGVGRYGCLPRGEVWGVMDVCPVGRCGVLGMLAPRLYRGRINAKRSKKELYRYGICWCSILRTTEY